MNKKVLFLFALLLAAGLACNLPGSAIPADLPVSATVPASTDFTPIPPLTSAAPATPMLSQVVTVHSIPYSESGDNPVYTITAQIPNLQGSSDPRIAALNTLMEKIVQNEIASFKTNVLSMATNPPIAAGSSFDLQYSVIGQRADIWSVKFEISYYSDGAAHPAHYSTTLNYDLLSGKEIALAELFLPNSNYLQVLSDASKAQLSTRDIGFDMFAAGADPLPENYQRWNISNEGLLITFDEYQVAPYAAGPQLVTIPFSALQSIMDPSKPLGWFTQ